MALSENSALLAKKYGSDTILFLLAKFSIKHAKLTLRCRIGGFKR